MIFIHDYLPEEVVWSWIVMDDEKEEIARAVGQWKTKFEIEVKRNPGILNW